jgi:hypothetical protein
MCLTSYFGINWLLGLVKFFQKWQNHCTLLPPPPHLCTLQETLVTFSNLILKILHFSIQTVLFLRPWILLKK